MPKRRSEDVWHEQLGRRIKAALERAELRQADLVVRLSVDKGTVSRWLAGKQPIPSPDLLRIGQVVGEPLERLLGGGHREATVEEGRSQYAARGGDVSDGIVILRRRAAQIGAGPGYVDPLDDPKHYAFSRDWIAHRLGVKNPTDEDPRLGLFKVARTYGDSMEPTIRPGATLLADLGPGGEGHRRIEGGRIYVLKTPGEGGLQVKRAALARGKGELVVWGDNRSYPPETISLENRELQKIAVGRVRWVAHEEE